MLSAYETPEFKRQADKVWTEDERLGFISWIVQNPFAGDVVRGSKSARKVRWGREGVGKSGGVRVIYYYLSDDGLIYLVTLYTKSERESLTAAQIKRI
jgi:mRNA-degrading endonuclease RelE of RelBE toxin-antitoxin system